MLIESTPLKVFLCNADTNPALDTLRLRKLIHNLQHGLKTETPEIPRLPVQPDARNDRRFWRIEKKPQLLKTAA